MKKGTVRSLIILAILLVLYLLITFVPPYVHGGVFWVSFVFTMLAFILAYVAAYIGFIRQPDAKSKFYGFPIVKIAALYLLSQVVIAFAFTLNGQYVPAWIPTIIYAVMLAAAAIGLVSADAVVEQIQTQDQQLKKDVTLMRGLQSKVSQMKAQCEDSSAAKAVAELSEALQYSDPVSSDAIGEAEADLSAAIDELQSAVVDGDSEVIQKLSRKAMALLNERNRLCKLNK